MPSGKTHDIVTLILFPAAGAAAYVLTRDAAISALTAATFLIGGLMFGPDLDTNSKQFSRWLVLKPIWLPYRIFFKHRSRWTHGLIFGSLLRVVYFMGLITLGGFACAFIYSAWRGHTSPTLAGFMGEWNSAGLFISEKLGLGLIIAAFTGLWAGAASHSFTDMAGTYIKTGRRGVGL